jgi:ankyrin repeat protein
MPAKGLTTHKLIEAIHAGSLNGVINALDDGEDIEMPDMHGYGGLPLRTACFEGNLAIVRELLNHGANPNSDASDGPGAPMRLALREGHHDIVDLLVQEGALVPDGVGISTEISDISSNALPEAASTSPWATKPDNIIEFSSSIMPLPTDEADTPTHFGTDTNVLSMDLLFLDENETDIPPPAKDKR